MQETIWTKMPRDADPKLTNLNMIQEKDLKANKVDAKECFKAKDSKFKGPGHIFKNS